MATGWGGHQLMFGVVAPPGNRIRFTREREAANVHVATLVSAEDQRPYLVVWPVTDVVSGEPVVALNDGLRAGAASSLLFRGVEGGAAASRARSRRPPAAAPLPRSPLL